MKERRPLVAGLDSKPVEVNELEKKFVFGESSIVKHTNPLPSIPEPISLQTEKEGTPDVRILPQMAGRVPITTRARPEIASALKRASLKRQLDGIEPYYVQDIMEQALEAWLSEKGYIQ